MLLNEYAGWLKGYSHQLRSGKEGRRRRRRKEKRKNSGSKGAWGCGRCLGFRSPQIKINGRLGSWIGFSAPAAAPLEHTGTHTHTYTHKIICVHIYTK